MSSSPVPVASEAQAAADLRLTLIIATKNRASDLRVALGSILAQRRTPEAIIIIDQSDDETTAEVVRSAKREAASLSRPITWQYIHDRHVSGCAEARNIGMDNADPGIWLFLDDDVELEPGFLEEIVSAYAQDSSLAGVSGTITNYPTPPLLFRVWSRVFCLGPFFDERQPAYWNSERLRSHGLIKVTKFGAGLMSFRSEAVSSIRFDTRLRGVCDGEDVDFCARVQGRMVICPQARLAHYCSSSGRSQDHWLRRQVQSYHYLYRRHWASGIVNRLCFAWLNAGYFILATYTSLRHRSTAPWRAIVKARREVKRIFREANQKVASASGGAASSSAGGRGGKPKCLATRLPQGSPRRAVPTSQTPG